MLRFIYKARSIYRFVRNVVYGKKSSFRLQATSSSKCNQSKSMNHLLFLEYHRLYGKLFLGFDIKLRNLRNPVWNSFPTVIWTISSSDAGISSYKLYCRCHQHFVDLNNKQLKLLFLSIQ